MPDITISDWTGKLQASDPYRLVSAGAEFSGEYNEAAGDADTVGLYHMNEAVWDGTANEVVDASGLGHHMSRLGGSPDTADGWLDRHGVFVRADGDRLRAPSTADHRTNVMTVEFWCYLNATSSGYRTPVAMYQTTLGAWYIYVHSGGHMVARFHGSPSAWHDLQNGAAFPVDAWTHVAVCYDGATARFYVNGQLIDDATFTRSVPGSSLFVTAGCWQNNVNTVWDGMIDDVRLSSVARYAAAFTPARFQAVQVRTADGVIDGGEEYSWTRLQWTAPAFAADETHSVHGYVSASAAPPTLASADWVLLAANQTGSVDLDITGALADGRYLHLRQTLTPSTGTHSPYQAVLGELIATGGATGGPAVYLDVDTLQLVHKPDTVRLVHKPDTVRLVHKPNDVIINA